MSRISNEVHFTRKVEIIAFNEMISNQQLSKDITRKCSVLVGKYSSKYSSDTTGINLEDLTKDLLHV